MKGIQYLIALILPISSLWAMDGFLPIRHLYTNGSYIHNLQAEQSPQAEKVTINSKASQDGDETITRKGVLVRYPNARATVVICHGFMCDKFDVGFVRQLFPKGKYNFLSFDFRAHGEDTKGQCCTFGRDEALDVIGAAEYVKNHPDLKRLPVFVYGFSMGAVASIQAQSQRPDLFKAMILDCPFDSSENVVRKALASLKFSFFGYEFDLPGRNLMERYVFHPYVQEFVKFVLKTVGHMDAKNIQTYIYRFSPAESIKKVQVPCLFIHCKEDKRIPVDAIHAIYDGAQGPKKLWVTNGRGHYDSLFYNPEKYAKQISSFFNGIIDGNSSAQIKPDVMHDSDDDQINVKSGA